VNKKYGAKTSIRIIYGGSVDAKNVASYLNVGMDGVLVGSASLDINEFNQLLKGKGDSL